MVTTAPPEPKSNPSSIPSVSPVAGDSLVGAGLDSWAATGLLAAETMAHAKASAAMATGVRPCTSPRDVTADDD